MVKSREEIMTLPSHKRKSEFGKRRMFRKSEAKRTLSARIKAVEEAKKRKLEEPKR